MNHRYSEAWAAPRRGTLQDQWPRYLRGDVVELGAASGRNAALLPASTRYVGLESDQSLLQLGRAQGLDLRHCDLTNGLDLEANRAPLATAGTILALDVFEHLLEPSDVIKLLLPMTPRRHRWIISVPNAVFLSARSEILLGRFPRRLSGLFDSTHRQFYTRSTLRSHLLSAFPGPQRSIQGTAVPVGGTRLCRRRLTAQAVPALEAFSALAARRWPSLLAYEWLAIVDVDA